MKPELHTLLCIEDDIDTCELVAFSLGMSGYKVEAAHSIKEGLRKAREKHYSLYSIDSQLPDGSGIELCQQLRKFDPTTPILFYSADAFPQQIKMAMGAGAQAYLVKPTDPDELTRTVENLLAGTSQSLGRV
jgi:two-component system, OmpR family, response regulator CpxR